MFSQEGCDLIIRAVVFEDWRSLDLIDDHVVEVFLHCLVQQNLIQGVFEEDMAEPTVNLLRVRLINDFDQVSFLKHFETWQYLTPRNSGRKAGLHPI